MTERENMLSSALYDANDAELTAARLHCKDLCHEFNGVRPSHTAEQEALIRRILGRTGRRLCVTAPFWCDYGCNIAVGENFYANHGCVMLDCAGITFGDNVFIGPNCVFSTAGHPTDAATRNLGLEFARPITVGDDVWFGASVTVLPGVRIGSGSVIGAGSVVTRDIPEGVIAVGNPCRVLRRITEADRLKYRSGEQEG